MAHLRALDGLRGLAVLAVVLYHFSPGIAPGGFFGVDIFFVLSGFLITGLLVKEWDSVRAISLPRFWARRARRLLPALFLVLAVVGVWTLFLTNHAQAHDVAIDGLASFAYVANWHFIASGQNYIQQFVNQAPSPLRHMWSLAIEEQFYLVWPLLVSLVGLTALRKRATPERSRLVFRRLMVGVCVGLGLASFVRMVTLYASTHNVNRVYYGTDSRAYMLLAGAAIGALTAGAPTIGARTWRTVSIAAGVLVAAGLVVAIATVQTAASWLYDGGYGLICLAIAVVLLAAVQPGRNPLRWLLEAGPLVKLGLISYGVYLWHWPAVVWLTTSSTGLSGVALFLARSLFTMAASLASYFLVEQPIRRGRLPRLPRMQLSNRALVPAGLITAVGVLLLVPALAYSSVGNAATTTGPTAGNATVVARYATAPRCDTGPGGAPPPPAPGAPTSQVFLVGNSVAHEIEPCLARILAARGIALTNVTHDAAAVCDFQTVVRDELASPGGRPDAVILFALPVKISACGKAIPWDTQVSQLLPLWQRAGVHVYLVPALAKAGTSTPDPTVAEYERFARADPTQISVLDAGIFLRDPRGQYQWTMPCVAGGEAGCTSKSTVAVRMTIDGGEHFCAQYLPSPCPNRDSGGVRRGAAGLAAELFAEPQFLTATPAAAP